VHEPFRASESISLLAIGKLPQVAPLTGQSLCNVGIGLWHALRGIKSALFFLLLFFCLPVLSVCRHSLRSHEIGLSHDQCPRLSYVTMSLGSLSWAPPGSPLDALQQNVFLPRRDGDRTRFIAWLRLVQIHRYLNQCYYYDIWWSSAGYPRLRRFSRHGVSESFRDDSWHCDGVDTVASRAGR